MRALCTLAVLVLALTPGSASADRTAEPANPWARARTPARGVARSIGGYSAGCVQGAMRLPLSGKGFQVMRPSRRRMFGHPTLIRFIRDLGDRVRRSKAAVLLIGDLGQPRGGPAPNGHSSHQSGLDVDVWYWHPPPAQRRRLRRPERETIQARHVVSAASKAPTAHWSSKVPIALRLAAEDPRVARIFVNPVVKRELCEAATGDRGWLHKLRPWWGHSAHFHVRLRCPEDSPHCDPQEPIPAGDGCAELEWWLDDARQAERKVGRKRYRSKLGSLPELPEKCASLIAP